MNISSPLVRVLLAIFVNGGGFFNCSVVVAEDWPRFRGADATAKASSRPPLNWNDLLNLKWKTALPGPGSSSPIVRGELVFLTCYSGYGLSRDEPGDIRKLNRHLLAIRREDGSLLWERTVAAKMPEDQFAGFLAEHGYASNTPTTDGQRVFAFFGKTGIFAFTHEGQQLWRQSVGTGSVEPHWGSAASLVMHEDKLIVNASDESLAVWALEAATGRVAWKFQDDCLALAVGTPTLTRTNDQNQLLLACPEVLISLSQDSGELLWKLEIPIDNNIAPSVVVYDQRAYITGGLQGGTVAVDLRNSLAANQEALQWRSKHYSYVATPVHDSGRLYWVNDSGIAFCLDAKSGKLLYRQRLPGGPFQGRPVYASPVLAANRIYVTTRYNGVYVLAAKPEFDLLTQNAISSDSSQFNATPAICDGEMYLRSDNFLYCLAETQP